MGFRDRLKHGWSAFSGDDKPVPAETYQNLGPMSSIRSPSIRRSFVSNERSILTAIINRMAIDVASVSMMHVRVDENGRYLESIKSGLQECLTVEANIDQAARAFRMDMVMTLLNSGTMAIVPVETSLDPRVSTSYDIKTMRIGEVVAWFPFHVRVNLYNEKLGIKQEITLPKNQVAIVENPLYTVMNEPSSTLQRLIRKLSLLDNIDENNGSGKLDMIIQLPYVIKTEQRQQQAENRRDSIEAQLKGSKYGIAYTDGTERITQLNRPVENNMMGQIEYLTKMLYGQLGMTEEVINGTADEATMLNYHNRTIEPILTAIVEAMKRTFLTKTARSQLQSIEFFRDPFKLVAVGDIAEIADKFTRNEILSANEIRAIIGMKPSADPKADALVNSNMPQADTGLPVPGADVPADSAPAEDPNADLEAANEEDDAATNKIFDDMQASIDEMLKSAGA